MINQLMKSLQIMTIVMSHLRLYRRSFHVVKSCCKKCGMCLVPSDKTMRFDRSSLLMKTGQIIHLLNKIDTAINKMRCIIA